MKAVKWCPWNLVGISNKSWTSSNSSISSSISSNISRQAGALSSQLISSSISDSTTRRLKRDTHSRSRRTRSAAAATTAAAAAAAAPVTADDNIFDIDIGGDMELTIDDAAMAGGSCGSSGNISKASSLIGGSHIRGFATTTTSRNDSPQLPGRQLGGKSIIGIAQMCATNDKVANIRQVESLICDAKRQNAEFLFLPECCDFVGEDRRQTLTQAEPLTGPTLAHYRLLAKRHKIWLSLGGLHESIMDEFFRVQEISSKTEKIYNTHVVVNSDGDLVSIYRKLHLFNVDTPEYRFRESEVVTPGDRIIAPISTPIGKLGLQICYDVRFPEVSLILRKLGAEILAYPSAFAYSTGQAHWEILLRARAIESQCFVVAAAQVGFHNAKRQSWGHAMVVNPWGKIIASFDGQKEIGVTVAEICLPTTETIKLRMPVFQHRRKEIYSLTAIDTTPDERTYLSALPLSFEAKHNRHFSDHKVPKETIFFESPLCYAFANLRCVVKGHVLVSTKRIVPRLKGLTRDEMADLFTVACKVQAMLEDIYNTSAATVTVQDGADAGQTIPHVHFHVMPRRAGDFKHNDQIYDEIEERSYKIKDRNIEERVQEAQLYRNYFINKAIK